MRDTINLLLLSVRDWRRSLLLVSAALSRPGYEIFFVDPEKAVDEIAALKLLASRLPLQLLDATGDAAFSEVLRADAGVNKHASAFTAAGDVGELLARFGPPPGLVCAPASDAARCIKGAVLAVRLGYLFLPCSGAGCRDLLLPRALSLGRCPSSGSGKGSRLRSWHRRRSLTRLLSFPTTWPWSSSCSAGGWSWTTCWCTIPLI